MTTVDQLVKAIPPKRGALVSDLELKLRRSRQRIRQLLYEARKKELVYSEPDPHPRRLRWFRT